MPRTKGSGTTGSAFRQVQQQARSLLIQLRKEIRDREAELARLKDEEETLDRLTGERGAGQVRVAAGRRTSAGGAGRINWRNVLKQLPKQFKASNIRQVRGLKDKRPSEIFAAITRWIEAGLVKRKARGIYERV